MNHKALLLALILLVVIVLGMFVFAYLARHASVMSGLNWYV